MKRERLMTAVCITAMAILVVLSAGCAQGPRMEFGPENHGLRLGLSIQTMKTEAKADYYNEDIRLIHEDIDFIFYSDPSQWPRSPSSSYSVRLDLFNSGNAPIVMVADWPYEEMKGDYAEFLKSAVEFLTFPEVRPSGAQTAGGARASPQPTCTLKPGEHLVIQWITQGALKSTEVFDYANTTPVFPSDGLYGVRARVLLVTDGGERILLASNEQLVPVGGKNSMPKYATAQIVSAYPDKKTATINLGSDQGIAKGDVFMINWGLQASWRLTITSVGQKFAEGTVETIRSEGAGTPAFPPERWTATLANAEDIQEIYMR